MKTWNWIKDQWTKLTAKKPPKKFKVGMATLVAETKDNGNPQKFIYGQVWDSMGKTVVLNVMDVYDDYVESDNQFILLDDNVAVATHFINRMYLKDINLDYEIEKD